MSYQNAFIRVAADCPAPIAAIPLPRGGKQTVASLQFNLLQRFPYTLTEEELLLKVFLLQRQIPEKDSRSHPAVLEFLAKPKPCLRASPLPKQFGWGVHYDAEGRIAIFARESAEYAELSRSEKLQQLMALRNKRER